MLCINNFIYICFIKILGPFDKGLPNVILNYLFYYILHNFFLHILIYNRLIFGEKSISPQGSSTSYSVD